MPKQSFCAVTRAGHILQRRYMVRFAPGLRAGAVATAVAGYQNVIEEVLLPTVGNDAFLHNVH